MPKEPRSIDRSRLPNAFAFVTVSSLRAKQLMNGCTPRVEGEGSKPARIAQREVASGLVSPVDEPEA
jgi:DNA-directed RNA polymerase omega subunit